MNILNLDSCTHPPRGHLQGQILPSPSRHSGTDSPPPVCVVPSSLNTLFSFGKVQRLPAKSISLACICPDSRPRAESTARGGMLGRATLESPGALLGPAPEGAYVHQAS